MTLRMTQTLAESYAYCQQLTRREAGNFYPAFRILPGEQRQAMCALYAFMRVTDDLSDSAEQVSVKRDQLTQWRHGLRQALTGNFAHPVHPALHDTVTRYRIPVQYLEDVIDGCEMDLEPVCYATFDDLRLYCYRVASAVGLACIHIWGFCDEKAKEYAEMAGYAFQLTNILRDLGEDAERGRVYLPAEELARFGYEAAGLRQRRIDEPFRNLMRFQVERARGLYESGWPLAPLLPRSGRAVFLTLARTYRALLDVMERRNYDVFSKRVRLSTWRKLCFALSALPVRWGWA
jgi:15-cis-phytoene synthase